jgi:cystathionine beta-lyase
MRYDFDEVIPRRVTDSIKWGIHPEDVLPLWVADMDFRSAAPIISALRERAEHGVFGYGQIASELRRAVQNRLAELYGWGVSEHQIHFLPGVVSGLNVAFQAFAAPGEGVLAQPPVYFHFVNDPRRHGRAVSDPPLVRKDDSYEIDFDALEAAIGRETRLFVLCNPHNPVGRVFTVSELARIAEICLRRRLIICSDEIHCDLLYPGYRHTPIATLSPEVAQQTVTLMSPSKTYNIAGLQCAYAVISNADLARSWREAAYGIVPPLNVMGHCAALAALRHGAEWLQQALAYLKENRDFVVEFVRERMPELQVCRIEATYLAWLDCRRAGLVEKPGEFFFNEARVALEDGSRFGRGGDGYVRLNFGCPRATLREALQRMSRALNGVGPR